MSDEKWLRQAAEEIRKEGHYGWGNTCEQAADRIAELEAELSQSMGDHVEIGRALRLERAENARLRDAAQAVVDSATPHYDRWVNEVTRIRINRLAALLGGGENV